MSRLIEQALAKRQIPYRVVGGGSYYDRMEVKDVLSMLRFLCNPRDGIAFHRVANKPARGMGDALVGKVEAFAESRAIDILAALERAYDIVDDHGKPLGEAALKACGEAVRVFGVPLAGRSVAQVANEVLDRSRYDEWLKERYEDKGEYDDRRRNVNELVNSIAAFCRDNPRAGVGDYLQSISLYTDGDSARDDEDAVRLMSLHASKGLEFDAVYLVGVEQGVLPHERAIKDRGGRALEEERRLCYVGFTRARKLLRVTWCRKRQDAYSRGPTVRYRPSRPSQFLVESGLMPATDYETAVQAAGGTPAPATPPPRPKRAARGPRKAK
jgi:DNA helicase-2/ATP-dependent DNA helicase PcrA